MDTQQENIEELLEAFEILEDWEDRYGFLMDLGRKMPPLEPSEKTEENRIQGCQSQVWIKVQAAPDKENPIVTFTGDSDSSLVKGLLAVLYKVYSGQPASKIRDFDAADLLDRLGLSENLSMNRRNGLNGMIQRIRRFAHGTDTDRGVSATKSGN